jgi:predicted Rossmann-fold nucleotide-binding protein
MKIAVYGSAAADMDPNVKQLARKLGETIAKRGHILLTGACQGLPQEAVRGAHAAGGTVHGYSPAVDIKAHEADEQPLDGFTEILYMASELAQTRPLIVRYKIRNLLCVEACDACVFISGRIGTLNELTLAYDFGKPIGLLKGTGGVADFAEEVTRRVPKEPIPFMIASRDIDEILDALEKAVQ